MYEILELHKSSYLPVFKDIHADVEAGRFDRIVAMCTHMLLL